MSTQSASLIFLQMVVAEYQSFCISVELYLEEVASHGSGWNQCNFDRG